MRAPLVVGGVAAIVLGIGAGAAWGYFGAQGSGSGATTIGHVTTVTVENATGTASPELQPGGTGDLKIKINNPNSFAVTIITIQQSGTDISVSGTSACTSTNAAITVPTQTGLSVYVTAGTSTITITNGVQMGTTSASACQGATFSIPITITVENR